MKRVLIGASIGVAGAIGATGYTHAAANQAGTEATTLEKVVVTAQKREESAQDVGVAITVLSGEELQARGISNVNQLQNEVPSLEVEPAFGSGQAQFRIRGIGFQDYGPNNSSAVGVYVDEVSYGFPVQTQGLLFDLERVEVLRGPQGTLYGKNTTGGAINFLTRKPTKEFEGGVSVGYSSYDTKTVQGFLSGPISESLRGRFSFATEQGGAWQHNRETGEKLGAKDISAIRGQLELDVTRDLRVNLTASYGQDKSDAQGLYLFTARPNYGYAADSDRTATGWGRTAAFSNLIGVSQSQKPSRDNDATNVTLAVNWDLDAVKLTSITGGQKFNRRELADWDGTSINHADVYWKDDASIFSQEFRLASNKTSDLNWVLGAYYAKEKLDEDWYTDFTRDYGVITRTKYKQDSETQALFGQLDYKLTQNWKGIIGVRQEHEKRTVSDFSTSTTPVQAWASIADASASLSSNSTSGKLGLEYQLDKNALIYGSVSRGIKSGGITTHNTFNALALTPFEPETLLAYETGFKADLSNNLRVNAAVFHYDYHNQQFQDVTTSPSGALIGKIINIKSSAVDGGEVELSWVPLSGLTVTQSLGYKHATFRDFNSPLLGNLSGKDQFLPKLSYGGSVAYAWAAAGYRLKLAGDYSYHDTYKSWLNLLNPDGGNVYDIKSYWLANARFEVTQVGAPWQLSFWVRNLFNEKYDLTRNFFGNRPGGTQDDLNVALAGQPRTVGAVLNYAF
ncbi:TonB-dependent receptor [Rhodocyclus tenuis]|uniref:Outer membrane receptor protein involved in Fe transport n=1 Tax=Rhodocyclus tenuis TaxID=1066 RepID=A0A840GCK2_RHOTE|nr:TonB-dependent receptor [Rhodocyclus tenuis]MBB4248590.1 outer membrane receptor protein involved in Fe transport [Rhodocyclus tenuis]